MQSREDPTPRCHSPVLPAAGRTRDDKYSERIGQASVVGKRLPWPMSNFPDRSIGS